MGRFSPVRQLGRSVDEVSRAAESRSALQALGARGSAPQSSAQGAERDPAAIAAESDSLAESPAFGLSVFPAVSASLPEVQDGRRFDPDVLTRPVRTVSGHPSRVAAPAPPRGARRVSEAPQVLSAVQFEKPASVIICVRRSTRRAVIFATGKHGGGHAPPRVKSTSHIWCFVHSRRL